MEPPRILSTNIKTRRLGYLRPIIEFLDQNYLLARGSLVRKLENWAQENNTYLKRYANSSGEITKTVSHNAAIRYLNLAKNLDFITKSGERYGITKYGRAIVNLPKEKRNPFELNLFGICTFLRRILLKDSDALIPLFELLNLDANKQAEILREYKEKFLNRLKSKEKICKDLSEKIHFRGRIDKIERWTNEQKYLENLVPPRLNWLIDLKIVDWKKYKENLTYKLNSTGSRMFSGFLTSDGIIDINKEWCENGYYSVFYEAYREKLSKKGKKLKSFTDNERKKIVNSCITEAFSLFKSKWMPRLTVSTFLEYTCTKLLITNGIICHFRDLKTELKEISASGEKFVYRWIPSKDDGFLLTTV